MKKILFSLMTLFALALMAGSANAQTNTTVTQGGIYSYTLSGIVVDVAGSVVIDFDGDGAEVVAITSGFSSTAPTAPAGTYNGVFTIKYSNAAVDGDLIVTITDGAGCSNHIFLPITVLKAPTIDLAIVSTDNPFCQSTDGVTENVAASTNSVNTLTFTVTPTVTDAPTSYTWGYTIGLPDPSLTDYIVKKGGSTVTLPLIVSGLASSVTSEVYTVEFTTTTGVAPLDVVGTLTAVSLTETTGGGNYVETEFGNNVQTVTVKSTPTIGSFN